jgi:hypothetical protein
MYDACLVAQGGNAVTCDAFMRMNDRFRTREATLKEKATKIARSWFYQARGFRLGNEK